MRMQTLVTTLGFALVSAAAQAQSVTYDFDKGTDFSKIKTYAWVNTREELQDDFNHKRIVSAVDSQLSAKGLTRVEPGGMANALVGYGAGFEKNLEINGSGYGGGPLYRANRSGSARVDEIVTGTLVIGMLDANTKAVIWRGTATKDLDPKANPEKRDKNVNKAVTKIFEHYPPKK